MLHFSLFTFPSSSLMGLFLNCYELCFPTNSWIPLPFNLNGNTHTRHRSIVYCRLLLKMLPNHCISYWSYHHTNSIVLWNINTCEDSSPGRPTQNKANPQKQWENENDKSGGHIHPTDVQNIKTQREGNNPLQQWFSTCGPWHVWVNDPVTGLVC